MKITGLNQNYNSRPVKLTRQTSTPINGPRDIAFGADIARTDKFSKYVKSNTQRNQISYR